MQSENLIVSRSATRSTQAIILEPTSKSDPQVRTWMLTHYSQPKGFVGRQLLYKVVHNGTVYGAIAAGSATRFLPGRPDIPLNEIINQTFFHIEKQHGRYPFRNFTTAVVAEWRKQVRADWLIRYGDTAWFFETLVELPRSGELYIRDGWWEVGQTKGYTCKRVAGKGTDSWSGRRVWDTKNLRPKRVFIREAFTA